MAEDLVVLRVPPALGVRLSQALAQHQRRRAAEKRRRRRRSVGHAMSAAQVQEGVWVDDDVPDNSDDEYAGHFFKVYESVVLGAEDEDMAGAGGAEDREAESEEEDDEKQDDKQKQQQQHQFDFSCVRGREYVFRFAGEEYHATMLRLPCVVEAHKTFDDKALYKSGDVGQMLLVHDVPFSQPRPAEWDKFANPQQQQQHQHQHQQQPEVFPHGITPPMHDVVEQRHQRFSSAFRLQQAGRDVPGGLTWDDIKATDVTLGEYKDLIVERDRNRHRLEKAKKKGKDRKDVPPTRFVFEEVIEGEPWMEYYPDDVIVVEQGTDGFASATAEARRKALDAKRQSDEKRAMAMEMKAKYQAAFGPSHDS